MADDGEWVKSDELEGGGVRPTIPLFTYSEEIYQCVH